MIDQGKEAPSDAYLAPHQPQATVWLGPDDLPEETLMARVPYNEAERLAALSRYGILDTLPEQDFDDLAFLASHICGTPIALVSLVDADRQWFRPESA
jgi:hypothetical protein